MNATIISKQQHTFSFNAPAARSVKVVGDFTRWLKHPISLQKQASGAWIATTSLAPGIYHYRFLVDGEWSDDPGCKVRVQNPFGTLNDVLEVSPTSVQKQDKTTAAATSPKSSSQL